MKCLFNLYYSFSSEVVNAPRHVRVQQIHGYRTWHLNKTRATQAGIFLAKGTADTFRQRGHGWEGLSRTVNSCCHRDACVTAWFSPSLFLVKSALYSAVVNPKLPSKPGALLREGEGAT